MNGRLNKTQEGYWNVLYTVHHPKVMVKEYNMSLPLHPDDVQHVEEYIEDYKIFHNLKPNMDVEFKIIEKIPESCYNNPHCEGDETCIQCYVKYAKLIAYPEQKVGNDGFLFDAGSTYPPQNIINDTIYSKIETAIIAWELNGTRTAGNLTRELLTIIKENTYSEEQVRELIGKVRTELAKNNYNHYSIDYEQIIQSLKQPKQ